MANETPGMIVAISAVLLVLAGAGLAHLLTERWVTPGLHHLLLLAGAGRGVQGVARSRVKSPGKCLSALTTGSGVRPPSAHSEP